MCAISVGLVLCVLALAGKQWRDAQMRKISDKIFNKIKNHSDKVNLSFEDLYIATLLVYK